MSGERNLALVQRYFGECVAATSGPGRDRSLELVDELLSRDFVMLYNNQSVAEAIRGRQAHKEFLVRHAETFPDDHWSVEAIVADENVVLCQWHFEATHAETGNRVQARAADVFRVVNGRLSELRRFLDFESFYRQFEEPAARP